MREALVHEAPPAMQIERLETALLDAFQALRGALTRGRTAVVIVDDRDLLGHRDAADAALANALVGLVRALAVEGSREGWRVNALAVSDDLTAEARAAWVDRLAEPHGLSGSVVRPGELQLGRVAV